MGSAQTPRGPSILFMVIVQVLLQSLSVAVTYVYFSSELKQMKDKFSKSSTDCPLQENNSSWDAVDDEEVLSSACWPTRRHLHRLIRKMVLKTFEETIPAAQGHYQSIPTLPGELRRDRPAAHITGVHRTHSALLDSKKGKPLGSKIVSWESSREGHSFLNKLHLRKGELVIQVAGFYYIYCQTYFRFREERGQKRENKQMVQYIYKSTSYFDPIMLMKSARNSCWSKETEYGLYSIYQGGLFQLQENDKIFVSVTHDKLVDLDQEASFFGAFLVG
uniref:tumor necrosis factor ligand superfamily member 10 n=1 Tax=Jaculus jaculus TaxID=51337 RepID=UPI001E1B105C|nr:tumor necrosis factor ligand superfamily member 10 [Jaculus jaculus]